MVVRDGELMERREGPKPGGVVRAPGRYSVILILTSQRSRSRAVRLRFFLFGSRDLGVPGGRPLRRQSQ